MANKWQYGEIGSISHGTMNPEDLIPDFIWELRNLGHRSKTLSEIERRSNGKKYYESEIVNDDLDTLFDMLDEHSPDYFYFGASMGDGSDYGFWLSESAEEDFDGLKVEDTSEIPSDYVGQVLHYNDHGNLTLYYKSARKLKEIWAVV